MKKIRLILWNYTILYWKSSYMTQYDTPISVWYPLIPLLPSLGGSLFPPFSLSLSPSLEKVSYSRSWGAWGKVISSFRTPPWSREWFWASSRSSALALGQSWNSGGACAVGRLRWRAYHARKSAHTTRPAPCRQYGYVRVAWPMTCSFPHRPVPLLTSSRKIVKVCCSGGSLLPPLANPKHNKTANRTNSFFISRSSFLFFGSKCRTKIPAWQPGLLSPWILYSL